MSACIKDLANIIPLLFTASYYRQLSADNEAKNVRLIPGSYPEKAMKPYWNILLNFISNKFVFFCSVDPSIHLLLPDNLLGKNI